MTESEFEQIIDRRVERRLALDREYLNAECAEDAQLREDEITDEEEERLECHGHPAHEFSPMGETVFCAWGCR